MEILYGYFPALSCSRHFNSAMTSIERGLAAADVAGALADSMSRDVYRQAVAQRVHHAAGGLADALWVNTLTSLEDAGGEGHGWNGRYGVYHGEGGFPGWVNSSLVPTVSPVSSRVMVMV